MKFITMIVLTAVTAVVANPFNTLPQITEPVMVPEALPCCEDLPVLTALAMLSQPWSKKLKLDAR